MAAVESIDVTSLARWVLAVHEDPDLGNSHRTMALLCWAQATGIHETHAALDAAREVMDRAPQVTAYVPPFGGA